MATRYPNGSSPGPALPRESASDLRHQLSAVCATLESLAGRLDQAAAITVRSQLTDIAGQLAQMAEGIPAGEEGCSRAAGKPRLGRILLVDDEPLAVDCITEYLDGRGYEILPAGSPRDALALAARRMIDLVVTDLRMAGMDGRQLVAELRRARPGLPAVIVTGHLAGPVGDGDGPTLVMRKPLALDRLEASITELMAASRAEPTR